VLLLTKSAVLTLLCDGGGNTSTPSGSASDSSSGSSQSRPSSFCGELDLWGEEIAAVAESPLAERTLLGCPSNPLTRRVAAVEPVRQQVRSGRKDAK